MTQLDERSFDSVYLEQLSRLRALVREGEESLDIYGGHELDLDQLLARVRRRGIRCDGRESLP
jgi:hypothetical protein